MLCISACAWVLLLVGPGSSTLKTHCSLSASHSPASEAIRILVLQNSFTSLASGWALMLVAMMLPMLIPPVRHIRQRSFAARRGRSVLLFLGVYATIWLIAGTVLTGVSFAVQLLSSGSNLAIAGMMAVTVLWQFSPAKQYCLNRGHVHSELAAFGTAADLGVIRFALVHGIWCVASCWALMLLPLFISAGHAIAMLLVSVWMWAEKLENPNAPNWRVRLPATAARALFGRVEPAMLRHLSVRWTAVLSAGALRNVEKYKSRRWMGLGESN